MDSDEEDVITYGTPVPALDDDEEAPRKKPIPIEEQEVRDERGLRRFHGAFTGGFSAGYFNTVGSKEGWAPTTYISSRVTRADKHNRRPEDFMDTEDLGEFGIAHRSITVRKDFAEEADKKNRKRQFVFDEGPIPGVPPLKDLIIPARESAGVKLLRKMGWKPGQGIGPRVKKKNVSRHEVPEDAAEKMPANDDAKDSDGDAELLKGITFAPDDVEVLPCKPKDDFHGIGYRGLDRNPVLSTFGRSNVIALPPVRDRRKKLAITGEAFGVGAFENDDENIYSVDDMSQYDFELGASEDQQASKKPSDGRGSRQTVGYIGQVLEGFHLSAKKPSAKKQYPPPQLPKNFQPVYRMSGVTEAVASTSSRGVNVLDRHRMNATERAMVIAEKPTGSVFNLLRPEDRARLKGVQNAASSSSKETVLAVKSRPTVASVVAGGGFQPFASDADKQKRYDLYLKLKDSSKDDVFSKCQPSSMTEWEKEREMAEFHQAAVIYKPLAHSMALRFVTAKHVDADEMTKRSDVVEVQKVEDLGSKCDESAEVKYGADTRQRLEWHPDRLLCRRFNIPDPYPGSTAVGVPKVKREKFSIFNLFAVPDPTVGAVEECSEVRICEQANGPDPKPPEIRETPDKRKRQLPNVFAVLDDLETGPSSTVPTPDVEGSNEKAAEVQEDLSDKPRPPMDLFKAVFQDTESDESSESETKEPCPEEVDVVVSAAKKISVVEFLAQPSGAAPEAPSQRLTSKSATGLFANLDLDNLDSRPGVTNSSVSEHRARTLPSVAVKVTGTSTSVNESYGPALPPAMKLSTDVMSKVDEENVAVISRSRREVSSRKSSKSHKGKHKRHKHKKTKAMKKHRRRDDDSSESSTESSDSDVCLNRLIKSRLKQLAKPVIS